MFRLECCFAQLTNCIIRNDQFPIYSHLKQERHLKEKTRLNNSENFIMLKSLKKMEIISLNTVYHLTTATEEKKINSKWGEKEKEILKKYLVFKKKIMWT